MTKSWKTRREMNSQRARTFTDYYRAMLRRKLLMVAPALVLSVAVGVALAKLPNLYRASANISIQPAKTGDESDLSRRLSEFRQQISSHETLEAVANKYRPNEPLGTVISQMRNRISLDPGPQPGTFALSYRATDPESARRVTDELTNGLVSQNLRLPSASQSEIEALHKRAEDISQRIRELEEKEPRLLAAADLSLSPSSQPVRSSQPSAEALRAQEMTIEGLKDQQYKFQQELAEVERRITEQRQIVEQQKKGSALRDNPTYAMLIARRTDLQGQRDTLINRQELTDKHPRVLAINDQIAAINRQIEELRQQDAALVSQSPEARELASLQSERNRVKIDLEVTGRELARRLSNQSSQIAAAESPPPRRVSESPKLLPEYLALKGSYKEVASQIEDAEAKSAKAGSADVAQLRLLEPANLPVAPVSPNRTLFVSVAGGLGLALGAILALLAESRRLNSLQDARDVESYIRLPLLAEIPKTLTARERKRAWWRAKARLALGTGAAVAITFALTRFLIASDVFALIIKK